MFYKAIVFLPLFGAIAAGLLSLRKLDGAAITASVSGVCLSFILSCIALQGLSPLVASRSLSNWPDGLALVTFRRIGHFGLIR